jgi:hypothetical protein
MVHVSMLVLTLLFGLARASLETSPSVREENRHANTTLPTPSPPTSPPPSPSPPRIRVRSQRDREWLHRWKAGITSCKCRNTSTTSAARTKFTSAWQSVATSTVAEFSFTARTSSGNARTCGGDTYYFYFVSGPERAFPDVIDHCNGSYSVRVRVGTNGSYAWQGVLQWQHNTGLDEELDPPTGSGHKYGDGEALMENMRLTAITPPDFEEPTRECIGIDHPARYVDVPQVSGAVGSLNLDSHSGDGSHSTGVTSDSPTWARKWKPFDCVRKFCSTQEHLMSLRGRMVMFVGDSTMRQLFVNFIPMVLGVSLVSEQRPPNSPWLGIVHVSLRKVSG